MKDVSGNIYYVAENGNDQEDGRTEERAWRTLGLAAEIMQPGDRCIVSGGTYRETITPAKSGRKGAPIRFEAKVGEKVVISGCDPLVGWTLREAGIYEAPMNWSLQGDSGNIVFIDGTISHEASWPHITDRLDRSQYAVVDQCTTGAQSSTLFDQDLLAFPDGYWTGAVVACVNGVGYFTSTARVTDFRQGTLYFDSWISSAPFYNTTPGDIYFLTRSAQALKSNEGWYMDVAKKRLVVRLSGGVDPLNHEIEAKRRSYAFDLRDLAYIEISGFHIRAASITTAGASHCRIEGVQVQGIDRYFSDRQSIYGRTKGIELGGNDNEIANSEIGFFEGIGINLSGRGNRVINCHIHNGNLEASYASLIWATGSEHLISRCTITRSGRTCVSGVFAHSVIEYCDISHANCLTKDSGIIYLFNHDFDNTDIHHNWLHDNESPHLSFGFYMDSWTSGVNLYRNVVWNIPHHGLHLNRPLQRTLIYNNTFLRSGNADSAIFLLDDMYGMHMINNIFSEGTLIKWGEDCLTSHNLFGMDGCFVDADNRDFRLHSDSPAVGAGRAITGVTAAQAKAPDLGAYETGEPYWIPGHDFSQSMNNLLVFSTLASKSAICNGGFESGVWDPWRVVTGTPELVFECPWDFSREGYPSVVRSNKYAAKLGQGDCVEQTLSGLVPGMAYELWLGVKSDGEYRSVERCDEVQMASPSNQSPDGGLAIYRDLGYIGPLAAGDWLKFAGVDFGQPAKYDYIAPGLTKIFGSASIEVYLDDPAGERIAVITQEMDYDGIWRYFASPIRSVSGVHDIYFKIKGPGSMLMSGFKVFHGTSGGAAKVSIRGAEGLIVERSIFRLNWEAKMPKLSFTTGPEETEIVVSIENSSRYFIYLDDVGLWQPQP